MSNNTKKCLICESVIKNSICSVCGFDVKFEEDYNQLDLNLLDPEKIKRIERLISQKDIDDTTLAQDLLEIGGVEKVDISEESESDIMDTEKDEVKVEEKKGFLSLFRKK
jgi:hypothetical protein